MKTKILYACACIVALIFTGCNNATTTIEPDDTSKFSTQSIVGTWVCVDENNNVEWYYDIKSNTHLFWMELTNGLAVYDPSDGYLHTKSGTRWNESADLNYVFDENEQLIRVTGGTAYGYPIVNEIIKELGSDKAFVVERRGLDEAYLWSQIKNVTVYGWVVCTLYDSHAFRIKGTKEDL